MEKEGGVSTKGYDMTLEGPGDENVLKFGWLMVAQICKYTENYLIVYFT